MIASMKKLTILCLDVDRDQTLEKLRELGVMHLEHVNVPAGETVDQAQAAYARAVRALDRLPAEHTLPPSGKTAEETVDAITGILAKKMELQARHDLLSMEEKRIKPYGSFDPARIAELEEKGIQVKLCKLGAKEDVALPENTALYVIRVTKEGRYSAIVGQGDFKLPVPEVRLPEKSLADTQQEMAAMEQKLAALSQAIHELGGERKGVEHYKQVLRDRLSYVEARAGMGSDAQIRFLQGFCPADSMAQVRHAAKEHGWGLVVDEPGPEDNVPTDIRSPEWVKPIKTIFELTGILPGYDEVDVSPVFLIALSVFFAMLVGDAGYGALFLLLTLLARRQMKSAPRYPFSFMVVMSLCTILWGVMTGTYFGMEKASLPVPYIHWLGDESSSHNVMFLCFLIGTIHLSIAHLWNVWLLRKTPRAAAHVGWVLTTITMFFVACMFVLGHELHPWAIPLFVVGLVLIVLFMTPPKQLKEKWFQHAMLPLSIINNFTDVVSYLRLFAVGTASYAVASAFNQMLAITPEDAIWMIPLKMMLLFLGHGLNIALCGLGILVHGVRLNTLEYSSHMGLQWKGHPYRPFVRTVKAVKDRSRNNCPMSPRPFGERAG